MDKKKINLLNDNPISLRDICKDILTSILAGEIGTVLHCVIATAIRVIRTLICR